MGLSQRVEFGFGFLCREKRLLLSIFAPIVFGVQIPSDFSQRIQTINTSYEVEADLPICRGGLKRRCVAEIWSWLAQKISQCHINITTRLFLEVLGYFPSLSASLWHIKLEKTLINVIFSTRVWCASRVLSSWGWIFCARYTGAAEENITIMQIRMNVSLECFYLFESLLLLFMISTLASSDKLLNW
jgi:hypothetical protein